MIDLNNEDPQVRQAFARLKEPGMSALFKFLSSHSEATKRRLVYEGDMVKVHRLQGRAELLEELLGAAEESATVVNRN
jgi:hypothetical protein